MGEATEINTNLWILFMAVSNCLHIQYQLFVLRLGNISFSGDFNVFSHVNCFLEMDMAPIEGTHIVLLYQSKSSFRKTYLIFSRLCVVVFSDNAFKVWK